MLLRASYIGENSVSHQHHHHNYHYYFFFNHTLFLLFQMGKQILMKNVLDQ